MDSSDTALYLQKIEELVYDNGDIITPTLLSSKWDINVNDARSLIEQYIKDTRQSKKDDLAVTYVVIGTNTEGKICLEVVKEDDLVEKRKLLKNVVSELINSVQKSKDVELNALAILEPIGAFCMRDKPLLGSIVSKNATKRKLKSRPISVVPIKNETKKEKEETKKENKIDSKISNKTNQKNGGLSSFVTKDANKPTIKPSIEPKAKPKNLMANFLSKQPSKPSINQTEIKNEETTSKQEDKLDTDTKKVDTNEKNALKMEENSLKAEENKKRKLIDSDSDENITVSKKTKATPKQKEKKKRSAKDKGNKSSKRRRIVTQDSDSDDIFESDHEKDVEDEDVVVSDEEAPPRKPLFPSKRKVRKAVSELVEDDDGYFKTVNKYVYESASGEEDDEKQNNKNEENKPIQANLKQDNDVKKKVASPPKGAKNGKGKNQKAAANQKQITSFFIKK